MSARVLPLFLVSFVACTGGGGSIGENGSSSGTSSSGSASSSGGSSSGGSSGTALACTEFVVGGPIDDAIGGSFTSKVVVQATSDFAVASANQVSELTTACRDLSIALGASANDQAAAEAQTNPRAKMDAWCKLAVKSVGTSKAIAGGTMTVQFEPPVCALSVQEKATCQGRCVGGGPCDTNANPMTCTGGDLSNGACEGGKLEGGCQVDAKCDGACDATVAAKASCPTPAVSVAFTGAADGTEAAKLEAALEAGMPAVLRIRQHCEHESEVAASFSGIASSVTDIKAACIPPVVAAVARSVQDATACLQSAASLASTAQ